MKTGFKALDTVLIKDDFYSDPDANRQLVLTKFCQEPPAGTPRLAVTAVHDEPETGMMCELLNPYVVRQENNEVVGVKILPGTPWPTHSKRCFATSTAVTVPVSLT